MADLKNGFEISNILGSPSGANSLPLDLSLHTHNTLPKHVQVFVGGFSVFVVTHGDLAHSLRSKLDISEILTCYGEGSVLLFL